MKEIILTKEQLIKIIEDAFAAGTMRGLHEGQPDREKYIKNVLKISKYEKFNRPGKKSF